APSAGEATGAAEAARTCPASAAAIAVPSAAHPGPAVPVTTWQLENCEVLFLGSVAVAVTNWPAGTPTPRVTVKVAAPLALVVTIAEPRYFSPSPNPEGLQTWLLKNSRVKVMLGVLASVPCTVVLPPPEVADVSTGCAWLLLPPSTSRIP